MLKRKHDQVEAGVTCVDPDTDGLDREADISPPAEGMFLDYEGSSFASQSIDNTLAFSPAPAAPPEPPEHRHFIPGEGERRKRRECTRRRGIPGTLFSGIA
jgi:hypothetical protein